MLEIILATKEDSQVLNNLLEKYLYEFSQWELTDVNSEGLYDYEWLKYYFTEKNRFPYLLKVDGELAGFVLVNDYPEVPGEKTDFCISEFFIMHKYRKNGYGKEAAFRVFDLHKGKWQLKRHPHNTASVYFWNKVVSEYTKGNYRLVEAYPNKEVDYEDQTPGDVFFFDNSDRKYKVITLCGSTRFKDDFYREQKRLTLEGNIVISVGLFGHAGDDEAWSEGTKEMLDDMHKRKIDMADEIFVINKDGYIGDSTRSEITYAKNRNIPVAYMENDREE